MKLRIRYFCLVAPLCLFLSGLHAAEARWTYEGDHGPAHWGEFGSELCMQGAQQSPINIETKKVRPLNGSKGELQINYGRPPVGAINNGHTIQANVAFGESVTYKGDDYRLVQFHFHTPSEHQLNNSPYPMEMHFVNQAKDGRLLVIGLMIKEGRNNKELSALWDQLPNTKGKEVILNGEAAPNLGSLIPAKSHHVFYKGSLTTPPCTEGVQWVLFESPIELSKSQIDQFRLLFPENHRPPQPVNNREVDED